MARNQTRKAISLPTEDYEILRAISLARNIPIAQIIKQAIDAISDGRLELGPAMDSRELARRTSESRGNVPSQSGAEAAARAASAARTARRAAQANRIESAMSSGQPPPRCLIDLAPAPAGSMCVICASEIGEHRTGLLEPALAYDLRDAKPGQTVPVCSDCTDLHPRDAGGRYDIGRSGGPDLGVGCGNRQVRSPRS